MRKTRKALEVRRYLWYINLRTKVNTFGKNDVPLVKLDDQEH